MRRVGSVIGSTTFLLLAPGTVAGWCGLYRYVRNPMYVGVVTVVLGQGLVLGSLPVLGYGALLGLTFHLFVLAYEEPKLRRSFAADYDRYCRNVSRWIPRVRPWHG